MFQPKWLRSFVFTVAALIFAAPVSARADAGLSEPICDILKRTVPEYKTYQPSGARAQFVIEITEKLDYDQTKFEQFKGEADKTAQASCPKEREEMLAILKIKALANTFD